MSGDDARRCIPDSFGHAHIDQMLNYVEHREMEGWYYGNRAAFEKRHREIKDWLLRIVELYSSWG